MSLATRCTHCGTIFKVVQDQLKVSEGWVRCGRCHEVFNALPALFDLDTEAPPPRQVPPSPPAAQPPAQSLAQPTQAPQTPLTPPPAQAPVRPAVSPPLAPNPAPSWSHTQPSGLSTPPAAVRAPAPPAPTPISAHTPLTSADLAFGGVATSAAAARPAATDFDLDTSVDLSDPAPSPSAADHLRIADEPRPWLDEPPEDVPSTDESDALESRYLLPSDTRQVRRRERGPEFADAQFPTDLDAEDEWARYQDSVPAPLTEPPPLSSLPTPALAQQEPAHGETGASPDASKAGTGSAALADTGADAALLRHPDPGYVPEQAVQPPSQRKGRSGTRGRDPASQAPEFVRRAQRKAFWRLPVVQATMGLIALLLALGLAVQLGHHFRDWIAAHHPSTRPLLNTWCAQVGCQIKPPMRLDALQVDSATLVRTASEGPDRYRLTVAVNSRSDVELAWPHIDLTLTDDRGTVIARRAFAPRDAQVAKGEGMPLLSVPDAVPAGESTQLQWSLRLDDLAPAGYTAELFYP
jgi:predicted Zn finger-like uncharacterized protein